MPRDPRRKIQEPRLQRTNRRLGAVELGLSALGVGSVSGAQQLWQLAVFRYTSNGDANAATWHDWEVSATALPNTELATVGIDDQIQIEREGKYIALGTLLTDTTGLRDQFRVRLEVGGSAMKQLASSTASVNHANQELSCTFYGAFLANQGDALLVQTERVANNGTCNSLTDAGTELSRLMLIYVGVR